MGLNVRVVKLNYPLIFSEYCYSFGGFVKTDNKRLSLVTAHINSLTIIL